MISKIVLFSVLGAIPFVSQGEDLLVVADEIPAMQILASHVQQQLGLTSKIIGQSSLPDSLSGYKAVIVYIHHDIQATSEHAFIEYAKAGGKLILLHHTIGSPKRKNVDWFPFLGIELPMGDLSSGGYKYYDPVSFDVVNLAPKNFITTHDVHYDESIPYTSSAADGEQTLPGTRFTDTEVYINHRLTGPRTPLLGLKYKDPKSGQVFMQDTAGWLKQTEKGLVIYFMPGHRAEDFNNAAYSQILINSVAYSR